MRKYWKLLVMSMVIIFAISAHYIQSANALQKEQAALTLDTIAGNESALDSLMLELSYYDRYRNHWLYFTKDGIENARTNHVAGEMFSSYMPRTVNRYIADYRSFMRGKNYDLNKYVESDERLVYAETLDSASSVFKGEPITFKFDVLHKETNKSVKFETSALAQAHYSWINVVDVYAANDEIKVLVSGSFEDGGADLQLYTVNEETQRVTATETLSKVMRKDRAFGSVYYLNDVRAIGNANYYVYNENTWHYNQEKQKDEELTNDYYVYALATGEIEQLQLPEKKNIYTSFQQGDSFYMAVEGKNKLTVHRYHITNKKWAEPLTIELPLGMDRAPYLQANGNQLYIANPEPGKNTFYIYDFITHELLYQGELKDPNAGPHVEIRVDQVFY